MNARTTLISAALAATFAIGAAAAFSEPDLQRAQGGVIALKADEGVPQNLVTA